MICEGKLISLQVETPPDSGVYKDLATFDCGADDNASDEYEWSTKDSTIEVESMRLIFPEMKSKKWQRRRFAQRLRMLLERTCKP
jgi:hypothetical protein